ncbi:RES family NAD+ phosphorylase [Pseudodesulfovibrio profundus]|nr:RES family NAD+ phosphorylase [Pseudodesulfovibrio profundus]
MKAGEIVFRARVHDKDTFASVKELGPPPVEFAKFANRMSPAGVVMFYAAGDVQTAIVEAASGNKSKGIASVGEFGLLKDATILDLTDGFEVPSIFDHESRDNRVAAIFMKGFLSEFRRPIEKDGREHVEYVPTQIMTEYFKYLFEKDGRRVFGIKYQSAQNNSGVSYVFFADQEYFVAGQLDTNTSLEKKFFSFNKSSVKTAPVNKNASGGISVGDIILLLAVGYGAKKLLFK